ncbi:MAG: hypothetical protein HZA46_12865 [Planctomycetales bacterium]|nr:hypothetical protein [Planctomycetales bacterium]
MNDHRNHHSPAPATHELLSAYFDRETTREEAVEIERLLERSPEARQMLDDFAELSELLHELPRHTLDASFADRVVQQTKSPPNSAEVHTIPLSTRSSRFRWGVGLGLVATAAAACVIVMVAGPWGRRGGFQVAQRDQPNFATDGSPTPAMSSETEALRYAGVGDASIALQPADDSGDKSLAMRGVAAGASAAPSGAGTAPRTLGVAGGTAKAKLDGASNGQGSRIELSRDFDIRRVTAGEVVEALQTSGDDVSVVKLTVVDVQKGFKSVQLLLTTSIRTDDASKGKVAEARKFDESVGVQPEEMWALFVQAPRDQMEGILAQIQNEPEIAGVRLEPAIAADTLNQFAPEAAAQSRLGQANRRFVTNDKDAQSRRVKETLAERTAESVPPATTEKKKADVAPKSDPTAKSPPALIAAPSTPGKKLGDESQNQLSRQLALKVPMDAIEQSNRRNQISSNQADRPTAAASRAAPAQQAKDGPTTVNKPAEPSADDTMQVLIVFQQRPTPASEKARDRKPSSAPPVKKS